VGPADRQASGRGRRITATCIVLGIDPGLCEYRLRVVGRRDGRLVALDGGVVETPAGLAPERRLAEIHGAVAALIGGAPARLDGPRGALFRPQRPQRFAVGQRGGVVMLAAGQRGVPCAGYTPQQVKGAVCGSGRAAKDQVHGWSRRCSL